MHEVPRSEGLGGAVQRQDLTARQLGLQGEHAVRAVVSVADADAFGVQEDVDGVQGREAGRVGEAGGVEEGREERFEAGARGGGFAGVDVGVERLGSLWRVSDVASAMLKWGWMLLVHGRGVGLREVIPSRLLQGPRTRGWKRSGMLWRRVGRGIRQ